MVVLTVEGLSKQFGLKQLFKNISFGIHDKDKIGLIGANGCGKSTLLKILAGEETSDEGKIMISSQKKIAYLSQNPPYNPEDTVLEAILRSSDSTMRLIYDYELCCKQLEEAEGNHDELVEKMSRLSNQLETSGAWELEANAQAVLGKLGINNHSAKMGSLSGGQRKRVALAHTLVMPSDLLILDEPTNHLDADTTAWLENYIQRYTGAVLMVTHDRYFLDRVASRTFEMDRESVTSFMGGYEKYLEQKMLQEDQEKREQRKKEALIKEELEWMKRGCKARTTKQKARIQRAEAMIEAPKLKSKKDLDIGTATERLGSKIIEFHGVAKSYQNRKLIHGFEYLLQKNDRIGVIGPNGSGKTTLLEMIVGRATPDSGNIEIGSTVKIGYYDQESRHLESDKRVIEYVREYGENIKLKDGSLLSASKLLERFLFSPDLQYSYIHTLSGGEKRRLYLLAQLMASPNVLLLDEPTNDLDIPTLRVLEDYLDTYSGCVITVSHDRYFLDRVAEHIFAFEENGCIKEYPGNYSLYLEFKSAREVEKPQQEKKEKPKAVYNPNAKNRKLSYKEKREFEALEQAIAKAEARQAEIETELGAGSAPFETIQALTTELHEINEKLEADLERWAELGELL